MRNESKFYSHRGGPDSIPVEPFEICGGQSDAETGFSLSNSVFARQYNSTNTPYSSLYYSY